MQNVSSMCNRSASGLVRRIVKERSGAESVVLSESGGALFVCCCCEVFACAVVKVSRSLCNIRQLAEVAGRFVNNVGALTDSRGWACLTVAGRFVWSRMFCREFL